MWLAHQTYIQSNIGLAFKIKLKRYHLHIIAKNKKLYNTQIKEYSPLYFKNVYSTHKFPIISLKSS